MVNIEVLEKKYIDLLLKRCINFNGSKILFISYAIENNFVHKLAMEARKMGAEEVYLYFDDIYNKHDILLLNSLENIDTHPAFNKQIWDDYALKGASFIILETEVPGLMDDIDADKLARARYIDRATRPIYKEKQLSFEIPWCIANIPNKLWAKKIFPNLNYEDAYNKLFKNICSMCMINTKEPIKNWNLFLREQEIIAQKLNELQISKMHYKNDLGTDLTVELDKDAIWASAGSLGENMIVNMPTYEIFSTPDFRKTSGIVYSSKPLAYNSGWIDKFYLEFKDGKVVNYDALKGKELLKGIIESDEQCCYLGEVALVNYNSPISNTGIVYGNTTIDENASCHLALGNGFNECIKNGDNMSKEELMSRGVNQSKNHVDFMIGTSDLDIEADTKNGKILIFKKGNFNL